MAEEVLHEAQAQTEGLPFALRGRYLVERRLSSGVHGPAWLLRDTTTTRYVVLRYLTATSATDLQYAGNLRRLTSSALRCPDAVPVLDLLEDGAAVWLLRDWIPGEHLGEAIAVLGRLTPGQARAMIGTVCRGLLVEDHLLVHGNLRPENVLIRGSGRVHVSDHGLGVVGTRMMQPEPRSYRAPELLAGEPASAAADVYALGALLYAAVCGRYPLALTGDTDGDTTILEAHDILPPPADVNLSGGLGHVIWQALQPLAADRYPSAVELLGDLGRTDILDAVTTGGGRRFGLFGRTRQPTSDE